MCMARAYFEGETDEERELLLEDIALVECDGKRVRIHGTDQVTDN